MARDLVAIPLSRPAAAAPRRRLADLGLRLAAALLAFAGQGISLAALPDQAAAWWGYGACLLAAAIGQGLLGVAVLIGPRPAWVLRAGVLANVGIAAVWAITRVGGGPFAPGFAPPPIGALDGAAAALALVLAGVLVILARRCDLSATSARGEAGGRTPERPG